MLDSLLDFLFPRRSLTGKDGAWITNEERQLLFSHPRVEDTALLRKRGLTSIDRIVAGSTYKDSPLLQRAIHTFKYRRIPGLKEDLADLILKTNPKARHASAVLCPVPLHWSRRFHRGFNQAALLADAVSDARGIAVKELLKRIRPTGYQAWRKRAERFAAIRNAFQSTTSSVPPYVILIDDLSTTGATLDECAKALKKSGAVYVEGWVVAHG